MKKKIILVLSILFLIGFVSSYECKDQTSQWNVPCDIVTPVLDCTTNASYVHLTDKSINGSLPMSSVGDGTYNISFKLTTIGTYSWVLCDNSSGTLDLIRGIEENEPEFNVWLLFFIIFFILLIFGSLRADYFLLFCSGCIMLTMGIFVFSENAFSLYSAVDYWFVYPLAWIFTGLGILLSVASGLKWMDEAFGE